MRDVRFTRDLPQKLGCVLFLVLSDLFGWIGGLLLALLVYRSFFLPSDLASYLWLWWFPLLGLVFSAFEGLYAQPIGRHVRVPPL